MESRWLYDGWWGNSYAHTIRRAARILEGPLAGLWLIQRIGDQNTGLPRDQVFVDYSPADMTIRADGSTFGFFNPTPVPFIPVGNFPYGLVVAPD